MKKIYVLRHESFECGFFEDEPEFDWRTYCGNQRSCLEDSCPKTIDVFEDEKIAYVALEAHKCTAEPINDRTTTLPVKQFVAFSEWWIESIFVDDAFDIEEDDDPYEFFIEEECSEDAYIDVSAFDTIADEYHEKDAFDRDNFSRMKIVKCDYCGCDFSSSNFRGAKICTTVFDSCDFRFSSFRGAALCNVIFENCNFGFANFDLSYFDCVKFVNCKGLMDADSLISAGASVVFTSNAAEV